LSRVNVFKWCLQYPAEAAGYALIMGLFRLLPTDLASNVGGFLARSIGPRLGVTRRALQNLRLVYPERSQEEIAEIVRGMWENIGRVIAEYPHLGWISNPQSNRVEVVGLEKLILLRDTKSAAVLVAAHLANWEIPSAVAGNVGIEMTSVVRDLNNPFSQWVLNRCRRADRIRYISKGKSGARQALQVLRQKGFLALLIDQRMNDGVAAKFMGHTSMTTDAPAKLAIRAGCPIIPVRIERLIGARFRVTCCTPVECPLHYDAQAGKRITEELNGILENWIHQSPQDWFWLHSRWGK